MHICKREIKILWYIQIVLNTISGKQYIFNNSVVFAMFNDKLNHAALCASTGEQIQAIDTEWDFAS